MKPINGATKKGQALLARARNNEGTSLSDVYGKWSPFKESAMKDCREWCRETNGFNFHICGHNTSFFSVAWNYANPDTGELMTRIETHCGRYIIDGRRCDDGNSVIILASMRR